MLYSINFHGKIPKTIKDRTQENIDVYNMGKYDAFEEAVKTLAKKGTELWKAWYYCDFRKFIPDEYEPSRLNLKKYPLAYELQAEEIVNSINSYFTSKTISKEWNFRDGEFLKLKKHPKEKTVEVHTAGYDGRLSYDKIGEWVRWELLDLQANGIID